MENLYSKLNEHHKSNIYPFHMPGHKRNLMDIHNIYHMDITEIDGFDNLHHAEGILKESQNRAAKLYGSNEAHFLVNGSTVGLLSAIAGCTNKGDKILMARNCHKAVYNAAFLNELEVEYIYPEEIEGLNIAGGISSKKVESLIKSDDRAKAVVITSPTYEGVVSDVEKIAQVVHKHGKVLIVDEAHGAHFGFHPYFPKSAIQMGADVVIQSLHKTMPSLTQSALLHMNLEDSQIECQRIREYLSIYQTSSPSYLLMGSMDYCMDLLEQNGQELFEGYVELLENCRLKISRLTNIKLFGKVYIGKASIFDLDFSKLVMGVYDTSIDGNQLYQKLLKEHKLQLEMATVNYGLAMTSCMDSKEGFSRLIEALDKMDKDINTDIKTDKERKMKTGEPLKIAMKISDAKKTKGHKVDFDKAAGHISKEYIYLYPPGIPLVVPGEVIDEDMIKMIQEYLHFGLNVQGFQDTELRKIEVVK